MTPIVRAALALAGLLGVVACDSSDQRTDTPHVPVSEATAAVPAEAVQWRIVATSLAPLETSETGEAPNRQPPAYPAGVEPVDWDPSARWQDVLATYSCPPEGSGVLSVASEPSIPVFACDAAGNRYLLAPADLVGGIKSAAAVRVDASTYVVNISLNPVATRQFTSLTTQTAGTGKELALIIGGQVVTAPTNQEPISGGELEISNSSDEPFSQADAAAIATLLGG